MVKLVILANARITVSCYYKTLLNSIEVDIYFLREYFIFGAGERIQILHQLKTHLENKGFLENCIETVLRFR